MKKIIILSGLLLSLSACTTMNFSKNDQVPEMNKSQVRHHAILSLVEIQEPANLKEICDNKEAVAIRTQLTPMNWLVNMLAGGAVGGLYSQKTLSVSCK